MTRTHMALAALLIALPGYAFAQSMNHGEHKGHTPPMTSSPSNQAYADANAKMHKDMDIAYSGNADVDFVRGMIPHHQGAIDMAKVVLRYGQDPEVSKLANEIIKAQEQEIAWMQDWLKKHGK